MMSTRAEVAMRSLREEDIPRGIEIISTAFENDPLWMYLLPDLAKRQRGLRKFFGAFVRYGVRTNQAYGVGDPLMGVAVWSSPDQTESQFLDLARSGFLGVFVDPLVFSFVKAIPIFSRFDSMHERYVRGPHYYLNTIGIAPEGQGKGLASALIKPFLKKADDENVCVYTETMTRSNVPIYQHYGFRVMEAYKVPKTSLTIWSLYRD